MGLYFSVSTTSVCFTLPGHLLHLTRDEPFLTFTHPNLIASPSAPSSTIDTLWSVPPFLLPNNSFLGLDFLSFLIISTIFEIFASVFQLFPLNSLRSRSPPHLSLPRKGLAHPATLISFSSFVFNGPLSKPVFKLVPPNRGEGTKFESLLSVQSRNPFLSS